MCTRTVGLLDRLPESFSMRRRRQRCVIVVEFTAIAGLAIRWASWIDLSAAAILPPGFVRRVGWNVGVHQKSTTRIEGTP